MQACEELKVACVEEIQQKLGCKLAYTTVLTVLGRLYNKGDLSREKRGRRYYYAVKEKKRLSYLKEFLKRHFFSSMDVVSHFLKEDKNLKAEDLEKIEKLIQEARKRL